MAYMTNNDKMLQAVLTNEELMKYGKYEPREICSLYDALNSDNIVINTVAQIIKRYSEKTESKDLYKEITDYLKRNV